jgi:hypothetical protein
MLPQRKKSLFSAICGRQQASDRFPQRGIGVIGGFDLFKNLLRVHYS